MKTRHEEGPAPDPTAADRSAPIADKGVTPPWEMVGAGRYMPRRIRGSFRGRELG